MAPSPRPDEPLRWTVNCLVCHTAEIDGVAYLGAGTKTFDDLWLGEALKTLTSERWRSVLPARLGGSRARRRCQPDPEQPSSRQDRLADAREVDGVRRLARRAVHAAERGRCPPSRSRPRRHEDAAPVAHGGEDAVGPLVCRRQLSRPLPAHGLVDGAREGSLVRCAGDSRSSRRSRQEFESVDPSSAAAAIPVRRSTRRWPRGARRCSTRRRWAARAATASTTAAATSTGPASTRTSGTDRARLDVVSDKFIAAFEQSPLAAEGALVRSEGYAATPLTGVWANYPYLHNGSVPTLYHLLGPVSERPAIFHVMAAGRFDRARVGQVLYARSRPRSAGGGRAPPPVRRRSRLVQRDARPGAGNGGHDVWPRIRTDENRRALIEYLKTL